MTTALRAEVRKLTTTQVLLWMIVLSLGLTLLVGLLNILTGHPGDGSDLVALVVGFGTLVSYIVSGVLGAIGVTGEYRHLTATPTFLSVPRRSTVIGAKLVLYFFTGVLIAVVCLGVSLLISVPLMHARGIDTDLGADGTVRSIVGGVIAAGIFGIIGAGFGALVRNQVAGVVGLTLYLFPLEGILSAIPKVRSIYPYLPGGATGGLIASPDPNTPPGVTLLDPLPAGLLLLA
jgi:ABC-2 type transport system permease protein